MIDTTKGIWLNYDLNHGNHSLDINGIKIPLTYEQLVSLYKARTEMATWERNRIVGMLNAELCHCEPRKKPFCQCDVSVTDLIALIKGEQK